MTDRVWREGDLLVTEGIGPQPQGVPAGQARAMAIRAATVEAQRNFAEILSQIDRAKTGSTVTKTTAATVIGARTRDTQYLKDGSVKVIMELPISALKDR